MKTDYNENIVDALLCLWEAMLELRNMREPNKASEILDTFMQRWGIAETRGIIARCTLIHQMEKQWPLYEEKVGHPFDLEYVPRFLYEYIVLTNLSYSFECSEEQGKSIITKIIE